MNFQQLHFSSSYSDLSKSPPRFVNDVTTLDSDDVSDVSESEMEMVELDIIDDVDKDQSVLGKRRSLFQDQEHLCVPGIDIGNNRVASPDSVLQHFGEAMWRINNDDISTSFSHNHDDLNSSMEEENSSQEISSKLSTNKNHKRIRLFQQNVAKSTSSITQAVKPSQQSSGIMYANKTTAYTDLKTNSSMSYISLRLLNGRNIQLYISNLDIAAHEIWGLLQEATGASVNRQNFHLLQNKKILSSGDRVAVGSHVVLVQTYGTSF